MPVTSGDDRSVSYSPSGQSRATRTVPCPRLPGCFVDLFDDPDLYSREPIVKAGDLCEGRSGQVDNSPFHKGSPVIDSDLHSFAIAYVLDDNLGSERQGLMRCGH